MSIDAYWGGWLGVQKEQISEGQGLFAPAMASAVSTSRTTILVTFDQPMMVDEYQVGDVPVPVLDHYLYKIVDLSFSNSLEVLRAKYVSLTEVELTTMPQQALAYRVTADHRMTNLYGTALDDSTTVQFTGTSHPGYPEVNILFGFQGGLLGMDAIGINDFLPDILPPIKQNENPFPGQIAVAANTTIYLEVIDPAPGLGINEASVVLTVEGLLAWSGEVEHNGYTVVKTAVANGFGYEITPPSDFSEGQIVTVGVYAEDNELIPNTISESYNFSVFATAPVLQNLNPQSGEPDVDAGANLILEVVDPESGVNPATITLLVNGVTAYSGETAQNGFIVARVAITNGYGFEINPPNPLTFGPATVGVTASNNAETPGTLSTSYGFTVFQDVNPPQITGIDPSPGADEVETSKGVAFSLIDDKNIELPLTDVWVNGQRVYQGSTDSFLVGWEESSYTPNGSNGYDFFIVRDGGWPAGQRVEFQVSTRDSSGLPLDAQWFFTVTGFEFPFSIHNFMLRSIRTMDSRSPGLLEKIIKNTGGLDDLWQSLILDRQEELQETLFDPYNIDARWLPWLRSIVGFTRDLSFQASEDELRGIIGNAVKFWSRKPSEPSLSDAIRMVTGNRFKIRNYFDFRMQAGKTYVTEVLEDFDPNVLSFKSEMPLGSALTFAGGSYPTSHTFTISDLPDPPFPNGLYNLESATFRYLQVTSWPGAAQYEKTYRIDSLSPGTNQGLLHHSELVVPPSGQPGSWKLIGANSEYITEVRLVDEPSGVGVVNRDLMEFLLSQVRPFSERIDVVYIAFLDEFKQANDLGQWTTLSTGPDPTVPIGGRCLLPAGGGLIDARPHSLTTWGKQSTAFKVEGGSTSTKLRMKVLMQDDDNYYFALLDYGTHSISLWKMVGGVATQIGSTVYIGTMVVPGYPDVVRIDIDDATGGVNQLRVKYNGETQITATDGTFHTGKVGIESVALGGAEGYVHLIEVMTLPVSVSRVGPNP